MDGEQPFIDGEFTTVRGDHGVIVKQLNMEAMIEDYGAKGGECQMEIASQM